MKQLLTPILLFISGVLSASPALPYSSPSPDSLVYGFGVQFKVALGGKRASHYEISVSAGAGKMMYEHLLAGYNVTLNLYRGGIGNSLLPGELAKAQLDLVNAFSLSFGDGRTTDIRPLYTWNPNSAAHMANPFRKSITLATNFITNSHRRNQQVGMVGVAIGNVQLGYYNDGPPFHLWGAGDNFDRWWTGGGFLHIGHNNSEWQFLYSFDKFTGYQRDAYEIANILRLNYVSYNNVPESTFNRGRNMFGFRHRSGIGVNLSFFDTWDIQDWIHRILRYTYHPSLYQRQLFFGLQYDKRA